MTYNEGCYGDFWRDLVSHASNLACSHVAQQTHAARRCSSLQQTDRQTNGYTE